jgi:hypothetical protein
LARFRISGKKSRNETDEELLAEYRSGGDLEVLGELYSRYIHLVYGVCLKYLREREESMDAVMRIFQKLALRCHQKFLSDAFKVSKIKI